MIIHKFAIFAKKTLKISVSNIKNIVELEIAAIKRVNYNDVVHSRCDLKFSVAKFL